MVIDRQYGSGGRDIGRALAQQLDMPFYDKEIIQMAAGSTGYSQEYISQREERIAGALLHDLASEMYAYSDQTPAPTDAIFEAEAKVMRQAAGKGDCVIVGRCADVVLKGQVKCLRVFLHAPLEYRVQRLMRTEGFEEKEARRLLRQTDRTRAAYYQYYTNRTWGAAWNYGKMKQSERTVRKNDLLFCGAPHLFIAHEKCAGKWAEDSKVNCNIATAYFELLANAFGLGTVIMSYPAEVLEELAPKARELLNIPQDHYMKLMVGFGYIQVTFLVFSGSCRETSPTMIISAS